MKTKKMTLKYWNNLNEGSRLRALTYVFPTMKSTVEWMANEKPDLQDALWKLVFKRVKATDDRWYKTCVNNQTYLP